MISVSILLIGTFICAALLTWLMLRYSLARDILDIPNERSSHVRPVPRGGGVAIVISFLTGIAILWNMSLLESAVFLALVGAGSVLAITGFIDDYGHIAARWRLIIHFLAVGWLLFWLDGLPPLMLFGVSYDLGWSGHLLALIALVWLLNLFNFMDGIDGIAGMEALLTSLVAGLLMVFLLGRQDIAILHILMSVAVAGFLIWNLPPAKIFMGDVGSGFIGIILGALALFSTHIEAKMLWVWLILLGIFIVDSSYTLIRRLLRGDRVYEAHCSHAYQNAASKHNSHLVVTLAVLAINLFWLVPWSFVVALGLVDGLIGVLFAYSPLLWLVWFYQAGKPAKLI